MSETEGYRYLVFGISDNQLSGCYATNDWIYAVSLLMDKKKYDYESILELGTSEVYYLSDIEVVATMRDFEWYLIDAKVKEGSV